MLVTLSVIGCTKEELPTVSNTSQKAVTNIAKIHQESIATIGAWNQFLTNSSEILITDVSRGFYFSVHFKNQVMTKASSGIVPPSTSTLTTYQWKKLNNLFSKLILSEIPNYLSPTCLRCSDGTPAERLTIIQNGVEYQSVDYDSNNPPVALRAFLNYAKSL